MPTLTFEVRSRMAARVRQILSEYVRLTVTERKKCLWIATEFTVQGPAEALERAEQEVEAALQEDWEAHMW